MSASGQNNINGVIHSLDNHLADNQIFCLYISKVGEQVDGPQPTLTAAQAAELIDRARQLDGSCEDCGVRRPSGTPGGKVTSRGRLYCVDEICGFGGGRQYGGHGSTIWLRPAGPVEWKTQSGRDDLRSSRHASR